MVALREMPAWQWTRTPGGRVGLVGLVGDVARGRFRVFVEWKVNCDVGVAEVGEVIRDLVGLCGMRLGVGGAGAVPVAERPVGDRLLSSLSLSASRLSMAGDIISIISVDLASLSLAALYSSTPA